MRIKHNDVEYEVDINKAISTGAVKPVHKPIISFCTGDVFSYGLTDLFICVIIKTSLHEYILGGLNGDYFALYSNPPLNYTQMLNHLNTHEYKFVKNLKSNLD